MDAGALGRDDRRPGYPSDLVAGTGVLLLLLAVLLGRLVLAGLAGVVTMLRTRSSRSRFALGPVLLCTPFLGLLGAPLVGPALGA